MKTIILLLILFLPFQSYAIQRGNGTDVNTAGNTLPGYDVTVCSSGCDYTSLATAFTAGGASKRYFVYGALTETSTPTVPTTSTVYFDNVTLTLNGVALTLSASGNTYAHGKLILTGTGTATSRTLFSSGNGNNNLWDNCQLDIVPTGDGLTAGSGSPNVYVSLGSGEANKYNIIITDITLNCAQTAYGIVDEGYSGIHNVVIRDLDNSQAQTLTGYYLKQDFNSIKFSIKTVDSGAGTAYGLVIENTASLNEISGIITGCDDDIYNGGSGTKNNTNATP